MISEHFRKQKQPASSAPAAPEEPGSPTPAAEEPKMTRAEHWAAINAERAAKKAEQEKAAAPRATVPKRPVNPLNSGPKTGPWGSSLLKRK